VSEDKKCVLFPRMLQLNCFKIVKCLSLHIYSRSIR